MVFLDPSKFGIGLAAKGIYKLMWLQGDELPGFWHFAEPYQGCQKQELKILVVIGIDK